MDKFINLMQQARSLFPNSTFVEIIIKTNEKDAENFGKEIISLTNSTITVGDPPATGIYKSYQFANVGKITLDI